MFGFNLAPIFYSLIKFDPSDCPNGPLSPCPAKRLGYESIALWLSWTVISFLGSCANLIILYPERISGQNKLLINLGIISTTLANYLCLSETVQKNPTAAPLAIYDLGLITTAAGLILHDGHCDIRQMRLFGIFSLSFGFMLLANFAFLFHAYDIQ